MLDQAEHWSGKLVDVRKYLVLTNERSNLAIARADFIWVCDSVTL